MRLQQTVLAFGPNRCSAYLSVVLDLQHQVSCSFEIFINGVTFNFRRYHQSQNIESPGNNDYRNTSKTTILISGVNNLEALTKLDKDNKRIDVCDSLLLLPGMPGLSITTSGIALMSQATGFRRIFVRDV